MDIKPSIFSKRVITFVMIFLLLSAFVMSCKNSPDRNRFSFVSMINSFPLALTGEHLSSGTRFSQSGSVEACRVKGSEKNIVTRFSKNGSVEAGQNEKQINFPKKSNSPRLVTEEFKEKLDLLGENEYSLSGVCDTVDFPSSKARFVRLLIHKTSGSGSPGIDELEIFGPDNDKNLALASTGAIAEASSVIEGFPIHTIDHLNNGKYGNDQSWIAASNEKEWVQIRLPGSAEVSRIIFSRDRSGRFTDRIPQEIEVLLSMDGAQWEPVTRKVFDRQSPIMQQHHFLKSDLHLLNMPVSRLPEKSYDGYVEYAFLRERDTWSDIPADDHLSPLQVDRPAIPGGPPYWSRLARMNPLERVFVQYEEMISRLGEQGLDVEKERALAAELRRKSKDDPASEELYLAVRQAKRNLFFRDPALAPIERILFAKRHPFLESHNYSEHLDGLLEPGGGVYVLHIPQDDQKRFRPDRARIEELFDGSDGIVREPVTDFDANRVYFSYRPDTPEVDGWESYWHMYSMKTDGSDLRQLTDGPFHDFDAVCLPDGGLAFHTTRCKIRFLCWRPQAYVLYRMNSDGSDIKRLSFANLTEWKPSVMSDGRILWTRSEYQDKGADFGHTLWAIRPDGTHPELIFGNNTPNCYSQAHEVPGTNEIVATLMSHGAHQGPVALIDRGKDIFDSEAVTNITPDTPPQYQMNRSYHNTFRDPYPISEDHFLVAHNPDDRYNWALYVIDRYGNREFLYADPSISSKHPVALMKRPRPSVIPSTTNEELKARNMGQFIIQDVYTGLGSNVERGEAKYLRVSQEVPSNLEKLSCGQYRPDHDPFQDFYPTPIHHVNGPKTSYLTRTTNAKATTRTYFDWQNDHVEEVEPGLYKVTEENGWPSYVAKKSFGTIEIEADGSANFLAPAEKVLYFHLLDENYNEIQRMRSVIQLQPGEVRSCIGCHEDRKMAPLTHQTLAMQQMPEQLEEDPWGSEPFSYEEIVQPVLNANCVSCHDGTTKNRPVLHGQLDPYRVPASYRTLIEGGWVHFFDFTYGMRHFKAEPRSFGTLKSPLWDVLANKHHEKVDLSETDMRAIKTWIDLNCPLWPDYKFRPDRPDKSPYAEVKK